MKHDLQEAWRFLRANRAFAAVVILTLGLAIGVNSTIFSVLNGVLLRPQSQPIIGRDNVRMYLTRNSDSGTRFTRSPQHAEIAASGDLAYTYGTYLVETVDMDGKVVASEGNYVTIWQKDAQGFWKFVVDTGNAGLKP